MLNFYEGSHDLLLPVREEMMISDWMGVDELGKWSEGVCLTGIRLGQLRAGVTGAV